MKRVADVAAYIFIFAVIVLSVISILGVWNFFLGDVITKSFESIGLLAIVAVIILIADHFIDQRTTGPVAASAGTSAEIPGESQQNMIPTSAPIFKSLRKFTLSILIFSVALLAFLGIMAIWDVLSGVVLHKSIASITIIVFSSLVIVLTCLERENNPLLFKRKLSGGMILLIVIIGWILLASLFSTVRF